MSEFSESYHLFTKEFTIAHKKLSAMGLNGYLFKPKAYEHWCTFVPFESFAFSPTIVSKALKTPVVAYFYAEDHGWCVQLAFNDEIRRYECSWENSVQIHFDEEFFVKLREWLSVEIDDNLAQLLANTDTKTVLEKKPAYEFCQALGLMYFDWLSPQYVVLDLGEYRKRKDTKLVGKIPEGVLVDQPRITRISLEKPDLSALEAISILTPHIKQWAKDSTPDLISMKRKHDVGLLDIILNTEGRLTEHGAWRIRFISPSKNVLLWVALFSNGDVHIDAMGCTDNVKTRIWELSDNKFDSPAVITHALQEYVPEYKHGIKIHNLVLRLREWTAQLAWEVSLDYTTTSPPKRTRWTRVLDARDLALLWESNG